VFDVRYLYYLNYLLMSLIFIVIHLNYTIFPFMNIFVNLIHLKNRLYS
jgi:hypothetical protein